MIKSLKLVFHFFSGILQKSHAHEMKQKNEKGSSNKYLSTGTLDTLTCNPSDYNSSLKSYIKKHVTTIYEGKKSFKCDICEFTCNYKSSMKRHVASRHKQKIPLSHDISGNHSCSIEVENEITSSKQQELLPYKFDTFQTNFLIQSPDGTLKTLNCDLSNYNSSLKSYIKKHVTTVYEEKKSFKCDICEFTCNYKSSLRRHVASKHKQKLPYSCDISHNNLFSKKVENELTGSKHEGKIPYSYETSITYGYLISPMKMRSLRQGKTHP